MNRYAVRDVFQKDEAFYDSLPPYFELEFEDGEVLVVYRNETKYSNLFWGLFLNYPKTKIISKHHFAGISKGKPLGDSTHRVISSNILKSIVETYELWLPIQKEPLLRDIYKTISDAQKKLIFYTKRDPVSVDILDFLQISNHPKVKSYKEQAYYDQDKIKYAYDGIIGFIKSSPELDNNGLAKAVRAGMVRENQVNQCVGFRGLATEVDGVVYSTPIWSNYVTGNRGLAEYAMDSRTAAKSHFYSDASLKDSEYRARIFQLYGSVLRNIVYEDCGSTRLKAWRVKGPEFDKAGTMTREGDLPLMIGKYYKTTEDGEYAIIQGDEKHLIGKTIWIRTVLGCQHKDPHSCCHVCAGYLSQNITRFTNLGHLGIVTTTGQFTQNILSIKHVNTSSVMVKILMGEHEKNYLHAGPKGDGYYLYDPKKHGNRNLKISIVRDEAPGLVDLEDMATLDHISPSRISQTSILKLSYTCPDSHRVEEVQVNVRLRKACSMLSKEALEYIKQKSWTVDEFNNFVVDMEHWDYDKPLLILQNKEASFVDLADEVRTMIQSSQKMFKKRVKENAPFVLLEELFDLVNSKLKINILSFEAIIYGLMINAEDDISMGRHSENPTLGIADNLVMYRSLGPAIGFQGQEQAIFNPTYHYVGKRPDSPMDVFINPYEVVKAINERKQDDPHNSVT